MLCRGLSNASMVCRFFQILVHGRRKVAQNGTSQDSVLTFNITCNIGSSVVKVDEVLGVSKVQVGHPGCHWGSMGPYEHGPKSPWSLVPGSIWAHRRHPITAKQSHDLPFISVWHLKNLATFYRCLPIKCALVSLDTSSIHYSLIACLAHVVSLPEIRLGLFVLYL